MYVISLLVYEYIGQHFVWHMNIVITVIKLVITLIFIAILSHECRTTLVAKSKCRSRVVAYLWPQIQRCAVRVNDTSGLRRTEMVSEEPQRKREKRRINSVIRALVANIRVCCAREGQISVNHPLLLPRFWLKVGLINNTAARQKISCKFQRCFLRCSLK